MLADTVSDWGVLGVGGVGGGEGGGGGILLEGQTGTFQPSSLHGMCRDGDRHGVFTPSNLN